MVHYTARPKGLPEPVGKFSHIGTVTGGELVAVAGQVGVKDNGDLAGDGELRAQAEQAFENIRRALTYAGCQPTDILKFTTYLCDTSDIVQFSEVRDYVFADMYPNGVYPPNTLLIVQQLIDDRFRLEIEALAVR